MVYTMKACVVGYGIIDALGNNPRDNFIRLIDSRDYTSNIEYTQYTKTSKVCLNWIGHNKQKAVNRSFLAPILGGGETYHLNHHLNPKASCFGTLDFPYLLFIKWFK